MLFRSRRTWAWFDGQAGALVTTLSPPRLAAVQTPVLLIGQGEGLGELCRDLGHCEPRPLPDGVPAHLATEERRGPWLEALNVFADSAAAHTL